MNFDDYCTHVNPESDGKRLIVSRVVGWPDDVEL